MKKYIKASREDACVGIWWYTDSGEVLGLLKPTDEGVLDGVYIQYSDRDNHLTEWRHALEMFIDDPELRENIYRKGYRSLERGRVIYNTRTQIYEVTCSKQLVNDKEFRNKIIEYYSLSNVRVEFVALDHYTKISYTGNSALDSFIDSI